METSHKNSEGGIPIKTALIGLGIGAFLVINGHHNNSHSEYNGEDGCAHATLGDGGSLPNQAAAVSIEQHFTDGAAPEGLTGAVAFNQVVSADLRQQHNQTVGDVASGPEAGDVISFCVNSSGQLAYTGIVHLARD